MITFIALISVFTLGLLLGLVAGVFLWILRYEQQWLEYKRRED